MRLTEIQTVLDHTYRNRNIAERTNPSVNVQSQKVSETFENLQASLTHEAENKHKAVAFKAKYK